MKGLILHQAHGLAISVTTIQSKDRLYLSVPLEDFFQQAGPQRVCPVKEVLRVTALPHACRLLGGGGGLMCARYRGTAAAPQGMEALLQMGKLRLAGVP